MDKKPTPDEQPKQKVAKRVVTAKRMYFVPEHGVSVEASSASEAGKKAKARAAAQQQKEGDD